MNKSGELNRRITILTATYAQDAAGQSIPTETTLGTVWAKMIQQLPSEVFASGSDQTAESVIFQVRNGLSIAENMVVVYNSKRYEINGIQEAGRNDRSNLICSRVGDSI